MTFEEFKEGKFSPTNEEIEKVRKTAEEQGKDADEAERDFRSRFDSATGRLREDQSDDAISSLERAAQKHLGEVDFDERE